jgi:hypothetical protein
LCIQFISHSDAITNKIHPKILTSTPLFVLFILHNNSTQVQKEIGEVASSVELFKQEMMRVDGEESRWVTSFEASRLNLIASLKRSYVYNARLSVEMKHLHVLTLAECGPSVRKRRMLGMRDALEELNERQNLLQMRLQVRT